MMHSHYNILLAGWLNIASKTRRSQLVAISWMQAKQGLHSAAYESSQGVHLPHSKTSKEGPALESLDSIL